MSIPFKMRPVGVGEVLPTGYKRVEYLETQSWTYINTGIYPTLETELCADILTVVSKNWGIFTGASNYYMPSLYDGEKLDFDFGKKRSAGTRPAAAEIGKRFYIKLNKTAVYINDEAAFSVNPPSAFVSPEVLCLNKASLASGNASGRYKFYSYTLYENGKLILDFIPCLDETGAPCMFDRVRKQTFYSEGKDDFLYPTETATYTSRRILPDWGKLTEHGLRRLYHAPEGYIGELYAYAVENGYKPIIELERPEEGYWTPRWTETEDEIVLEWVETGLTS